VRANACHPGVEGNNAFRVPFTTFIEQISVTYFVHTRYAYIPMHAGFGALDNRCVKIQQMLQNDALCFAASVSKTPNEAAFAGL